MLMNGHYRAETREEDGGHGERGEEPNRVGAEGAAEKKKRL